MTNEERDIIAAFVARVGGAPAAQQSPWGGASVPATQAQAPQPQPDLPPVDPEADKFIAEQFQAHPEARYRITQLAFVQEHALIEAQNRMKQMQWQMQQMQQAMQQQAQQGGRGGGFFSNLFGGGRSASSAPPPPGAGPWGQAGQAPPQYQQPHYPPPPPPQYPAGYQPGVFQRSGGSGFLGSALTTAAGVAGGIFAADAIRDMFSPHRGFMGGSPWGGAPTESGAGPWADPSAGQGYVDQGQWDQPTNDPGAWNDPGQAAPDAGGWDQGGADQGGGGWDQGGGDMGGDVGGGDWGGGDQGGGDDSLF